MGQVESAVDLVVVVVVVVVLGLLESLGQVVVVVLGQVVVVVRRAFCLKALAKRFAARRRHCKSFVHRASQTEMAMCSGWMLLCDAIGGGEIACSQMRRVSVDSDSDDVLGHSQIDGVGRREERREEERREEGRAYEAGGPLLVGADRALPHKRSLVLVIAAWVVGKRSL